MKLMHLGDLHFGKIVNEFNMLEDQRYIVEQILHIARENHPDAVLLAGDIYDRNIPPAPAVELLDDFLTRLAEMGLPVCLISGNHDSPERLNFGGRLLGGAGIHICCTPEDTMKPVRFKDAYGEVTVWMVPYMKSEALLGCIERLPVDAGGRNVLVAHGFITAGEQSPELSDSESPLYVGGLDAVDVSAFDGFDYVALGHLHKHQRVGRDTVRYAGAPLKYSFSEAAGTKAVTMVELREKGQTDISLIPLKALHDMRKIRGELAQLISPEVYTLADTEDYLHVTLTDAHALLDPMNTLRSVYPNVMQIAFERRLDDDLAAVPQMSVESAAVKSEKELFTDFYQYVMGNELDEERSHIMEAVIDEAGKIDN